MAQLPGGFLTEAKDYFPTQQTEQLLQGLKIKQDVVGTLYTELLSELQFTVAAYRCDAARDKDQRDGVYAALKSCIGEEVDFELASKYLPAAAHWVRLHGGKKQDTRKAIVKFRKKILQPNSGRLVSSAKYTLAVSLARILSKYTDEPITTSRHTEAHETNDGALATIFQRVLIMVDGVRVVDPFPYLCFAKFA